jgi:hypothetical protein
MNRKRKLTLGALRSLTRTESKSPEFFCWLVDMTVDTLFNYETENLDLDILYNELINKKHAPSFR